ncbi:AAA family ATPase [Agrobacterium rubi]|nr:AAA family ATPase [Agrobacterium rubi]NTF24310.1 AAA family ATPase [Agrobacterium rubi]
MSVMSSEVLIRHRQYLAEVSRLIANAEGQLTAESDRKARLEREVGEAKGRRERNPVYAKFLEEMQAEAHARNVGKFERLLTTILNEFMPNQPPIGLDLTIKRGQPALEIVSRVAADLSKDIYKHKGGAVTNIMSLALRMMVLVRSRRRRFLILDEADCWTQSEKIPTFYNIARSAGAKLGVQCVAISHWPSEKFGEGMNVARLSGHPEAATGTNINNNPRPYQWTDEEDGFRYIRLRNFQGYIDETLYLTPGVTIISGDNDLGKSSIGRAMRAVFYGDIDDGLIRDGERMCAVEIGLKGGRVLRWDRQLKRNPVNLWKLLEADGSVVTVMDEGGQIVRQYETGGDVPDWVEQEFGISKVQGLDVHLMLQKEPVFLLDESPQVRATALSVGQESNYISGMIQKHKEQVAADSATIREGEKEMSRIIDKIARIEKALEYALRLPEAEVIHERIIKRDREVSAIAKMISDIEDALEIHRTLEDRRAMLAYLPEPESIRSIEQGIRKVDRYSEILSVLEQSVKEAHRAKAIADVLASLPDGLPVVRKTDHMIVLGRNIATSAAEEGRLRKLKEELERLPESLPMIRSNGRQLELVAAIETGSTELEQGRLRLTETDKRMAAVQAELDQIVQSMGHVCTVCGNHIEDAAQLVAAHAHGDH